MFNKRQQSQPWVYQMAFGNANRRSNHIEPSIHVTTPRQPRYACRGKRVGSVQVPGGGTPAGVVTMRQARQTGKRLPRRRVTVKVQRMSPGIRKVVSGGPVSGCRTDNTGEHASPAVGEPQPSRRHRPRSPPSPSYAHRTRVWYTHRCRVNQ